MGLVLAIVLPFVVFMLAVTCIALGFSLGRTLGQKEGLALLADIEKEKNRDYSSRNS